MSTAQPTKPHLPPYRSIRCHACGRRLGDFLEVPGMGYRIKCPKCGAMNAARLNLNSTGVLVFFSLLNHCNGSAPEIALQMMRQYMDNISTLDTEP